MSALSVTPPGKSTLIQHLNGLIEPQSGKVYVDGADIWSKQNRKQIRRVRFQVGLCFQYPEYQIFEEDVYKEIAFGPKQMGLDSEEIRRRVFHSMELVGLSVILRSNRPLICPVGKSAVWPLRPFWQWSQRF